MIEESLGRLWAIDWDNMTARLLSAAGTLAVRYGWTITSMLPRGESLEDIVVETISDIWDEPERLKPEVDLFVQLCGIIRHKLWNLSQSPDEDVKRVDDLAGIAPTAKGGASAVDTKDEFRRAIDLLLASAKVRENTELELVVMAMSCGAIDTDELVRETGLTTDRIYQLRRELRAIYPTIANQLRSK